MDNIGFNIVTALKQQYPKSADTQYAYICGYLETLLTGVSEVSPVAKQYLQIRLDLIKENIKS